MLMRISAMCSLTLSNIGNNAITQHKSALVFGLGWLWCCFDVSFSADDDGRGGNGGKRKGLTRRDHRMRMRLCGCIMYYIFGAF